MTTIVNPNTSNDFDFDIDEKSLDYYKSQQESLTLTAQEEGQKFPSLQISTYQPTPKEEINWIFTEESARLFSADCFLRLRMDPIPCYFTTNQQEPILAFKPTAELRFIPLYVPRNFVETTIKTDSGDQKVISEIKGKLVPGQITKAKLFLAIIADEELLEVDGKIEVVSLNLKSFQTSEVLGYSASDPNTLKSLSAKLKEKGLVAPNVHNTSLLITPKRVIRTSKRASDKSSPSIKYELSGAKLNPPQFIEKIIPMLNDPEFQEYLIDPFGINRDKNKTSNDDNVATDDWDGSF